jgi:hypothetical protein
MLAFLAVAFAHDAPVVVDVGPEDDWCGAFRDMAQGGELILLAPGDYYGPCDLVGKSPAQAYTYNVLGAQDDADRPRMHWDGSSDHILRVDGQWVQLVWLDFPDVPAGVDAVQVAGGANIWVFDSNFDAVAGTAVRGNALITGLRISEIAIHGAGGTGVDVGCADGSCFVWSLELEHCLFSGVSVGATVAAAQGAVDDNVIDAAVAVDVGGGDGALLSLGGNLFRGSALAHGPSTWENDIFVGPFHAVPGSGVWKDVKLYGNTLYDPAGAPLDLQGFTASGGFALQDNAIGGPIPSLEGELSGNVACVDADCWVDAPALDFYPRATGPLATSGVSPDPGRLFDDWCGLARADPPTVGALELGAGTFGPLAFDRFKDEISCLALPSDTGLAPGGADTAASVPPPDADRAGCGCQDAGAPSWIGGFALLLVTARRASPSPARPGRPGHRSRLPRGPPRSGS